MQEPLEKNKKILIEMTISMTTKSISAFLTKKPTSRCNLVIIAISNW